MRGLYPPLTISRRQLWHKVLRRVASYLCPVMTLCWAVALYRVTVLRESSASCTALWYGIHGLWYLKSLATFTLLLVPLSLCRSFWQQVALALVVYVLLNIGFRELPTLNRLTEMEYSQAFFAFFMLGYWARRYSLLVVLRRANWLFTLSLIGFACLFATHFSQHYLEAFNWRLLRPACAVVAITAFFQSREHATSRVERWLEHIGTRTLDIYLYHWLFIDTGLVSLTCLRDWAAATANPFLCLMAATAVSIAIAYVAMSVGMLLRCSDIARRVVYGEFLSSKNY